MTIRAVVFDIGGVLEIAPPTGWVAQWERHLQRQPGDLQALLRDVWRGGSIGAISEAEVERRTGEILGLDATQVAAFMADLWTEYLGTLNAELTAYFASLRPRYQTAILSNSFVGAREKEQERYGFGDICDLIIYSHEVGMQKPDRRIYALTCERLAVRPVEMIFLDDVEVCVSAAREFGIQAIRFRDTAQAITAIEAGLASGSA